MPLPYSKGMPKISSKNQITVPVAALEGAHLHAGDQVIIEVIEERELRIRRNALDFESAFGALTGVYPPGYLDQLDQEDEER
jgi:AbrB family looped-hinge helix DNA binding protein